VDAIQSALPLDTIVEGQLVTYRLVFNRLPPSKNVYDSWPAHYKSSAKRAWTGTRPGTPADRAKVGCVEKACREQGVPLGLPKVGLAAKLIFPTDRTRDYQNYAQTLWNFIPDALVWSGILINDDAGRVEIGPNWGVTFGVDYRPRVDIKHRRWTVLTLACFQAVQRPAKTVVSVAL
jgi:hypothetical protein